MAQDTDAGWGAAIQHHTGVDYDRMRDQHIATCACGWVGGYWVLRNYAEDEAARHATANLFGNAGVSR